MLNSQDYPTLAHTALPNTTTTTTVAIISLAAATAASSTAAAHTNPCRPGNVQARHSMLEKLQEIGDDQYNVVFMDPDIFIVGDLTELFAWNFDYAATVSAGEGQPINGAMHFVRAHNYAPAVRILKEVLKGWVALALPLQALGLH